MVILKAVILDTNHTEKIIEHLIAYGYDSFIIFREIETEYYRLNGVSITILNNVQLENTREIICKIRGSLKERFIIIYSSDILEIDLDGLYAFHHRHQCVATLINSNCKLSGALLESEIFDYLENPCSFEKEALLKAGQDGEIRIYK